MMCTEEYKERIEYTFHTFVRLSYGSLQSTQSGQEVGDKKEKYFLNTLTINYY